MLALREHAFNGTEKPSEFYLGECLSSDWLSAAQEKEEDRSKKVRSLRHMRKYTCANFLGRIGIVFSDLFEYISHTYFSSKPKLTGALE